MGSDSVQRPSLVHRPILVDDQVVPTSDPAIVQVPGMNILDRAVRLGVMPDDLIRPVPVSKTAMKP